MGVSRMENKRVLYAASTMSHINNFHLDCIDALKREGYTVSIMAHGNGADFDVPFEKRLFSRRNRQARRMIADILNRECFELAVLNTSLAAFHIRAAMSRRGRCRTVNIVHGYLFSDKTALAKRLLLIVAEWLMRRRTDRIITMNEYDYIAAKKYSLAKDIRRSLGMGFSLRPQISDADNLRREFFGCGRFVITFVGELSKRKNQSFLISALPQLTQRIRGCTLCLVGTGDELSSLRSLADRLGVAGHVVFTGYRADACDFIRASDLYVSASHSEGLPHNVLEALALGKTVLLSDVKGHSDLISDGINGYLYEPDNLTDFVNKTFQIYNNNTLNAKKIQLSCNKYFKENALPIMLALIKGDCIR